MLKRTIGFSLFFLIFFLTYTILNYYVYINLVQGLSLTGWQVNILRPIFFILAAAYPFSQTFKSKFKLPRLAYLGAFWMGILTIAVVVFAIKDAATWVLSTGNLEFPAILTIVTLTLLSTVRARKGPKLKPISISNLKSPHKLNIVHLSDIHLGVLTSHKWLNRVVNKVNSLDPDIVVITGDMVDDSFSSVEQFVPTMANLKAKYGVFAVSGNHEYYNGIKNFHRFCEAANITVADNKLIPITQGVNILGIEDKLARQESNISKKISELLATDNADNYNILLVHQPLGFNETAKLGIDLQLSGHTHRGQIFPFNLVVPLAYRYAYGLHSLANSHIYTSSGTGTWGPPMRLGSSSEIVKIQVG